MSKEKMERFFYKDRTDQSGRVSMFRDFSTRFWMAIPIILGTIVILYDEYYEKLIMHKLLIFPNILEVVSIMLAAFIFFTPTKRASFETLAKCGLIFGGELLIFFMNSAPLMSLFQDNPNQWIAINYRSFFMLFTVNYGSTILYVVLITLLWRNRLVQEWIHKSILYFLMVLVGIAQLLFYISLLKNPEFNMDEKTWVGLVIGGSSVIMVYYESFMYFFWYYIKHFNPTLEIPKSYKKVEG